ncbi:MAG TPA: hypothetical protein VF487_20245 [Chitinophagaceae bacterium]
MTDYRKGSMGAADAKNEKTGIIVFSIIFAIAYLLWILPTGLFSHYYFKNAGAFWKVLGFISIGIHYWFIWKKFRDIDNPVGGIVPPQTLVLFGWFVLNLLLLSGFSFNLPAGS